MAAMAWLCSPFASSGLLEAQALLLSTATGSISALDTRARRFSDLNPAERS